MFVHSFGDKVQALDAATGDLLWQYSRRLPTGVAPSVKRGISIFGTRLYVPTSDAHVVALDVKTGKVVWDQAVGDRQDGLSGSPAAPLVARGKVMIGTTGRAPGGNFIVALDAETGKEAWRFNTIARPGEAGRQHLERDAAREAERRLGVDSRQLRSGSQPRVLRSGQYLRHRPAAESRSIGRASRTTRCISIRRSRINPDTGQLRVVLPAPGQRSMGSRLGVRAPDPASCRSTVACETVVLTAGKQMIFDIVEAETGKYLSSIDLGLQNLVTAIDPKTGAKTIDTNLVPGDGQTKMICPHVSGGRGWMPTSYDAATKMLYMPIVEACMDLVPVPKGERGSLSTGVRWTVRPRPGSDGNYGRLQALNVETRKTVWIERQRAPFTTGTLATAGGLVFAGALDRMFQALRRGHRRACCGRRA